MLTGGRVFAEDLRKILRMGIAGLELDEEILEAILAATRDSRERFQDVVLLYGREVEDSTNDGVGVPQRTLPGMQTGQATVDGLSHPYAGFKSAIQQATKLGIKRSIVDMGRTWAGTHEGLVQSRELSRALREMGASQSSMEYLPGVHRQEAACLGGV